MLVDNTPSTADSHGRSPADATPFGRGLGTVMLDRRTKEWRRRRELIDMFTTALGGRAAISAVLAAKVEVAAELAVAAELCRAAYMAGGDVTTDDLVRVSNQAQRAERALGIGAKQAPAKTDLAAYLANRTAAA